MRRFSLSQYDDLELTIMSCLLQKPELMNDVIIEDKYFVNHQKLWQFMKAFYKKFGNFDVTLMCTVCKNKYRIVEYANWVLNLEPCVSLFKQYQKRLIELHEQKEKNKYIIDKIYTLANHLFVENITVEYFKEQVEEIYKNADEIFKSGEENDVF